jgi:hypothetical protein
MSHERWGALSVRDHRDLEGMVTNVLLYDRLVVPEPADAAERERWTKQLWDPELLGKTLDQLGDLAIRKPWDERRQAAYRNALESARAVSVDADNIVRETVDPVSYRMTRMVLAQEAVVDLPAGVTRVDVVAAFNSAKSAGAEFSINKTNAPAGAVLLRHEVAVPAVAANPDALQQAIGLSRDREFQDKRRDFYDWQTRLLEGNVDSNVIGAELRELVEGYNRAVEKAVRKVNRKFVFVIGSIAVSLAGAVISMNPLPAVGALITFVSFATLDGKPAIDPGRYRAAAMFHDARKLFD